MASKKYIVIAIVLLAAAWYFLLRKKPDASSTPGGSVQELKKKQDEMLASSIPSSIPSSKSAEYFWFLADGGKAVVGSDDWYINVLKIKPSVIDAMKAKGIPLQFTPRAYFEMSNLTDPTNGSIVPVVILHIEFDPVWFPHIRMGVKNSPTIKSLMGVSNDVNDFDLVWNDNPRVNTVNNNQLAYPSFWKLVDRATYNFIDNCPALPSGQDDVKNKLQSRISRGVFTPDPVVPEISYKQWLLNNLQEGQTYDTSPKYEGQIAYDSVLVSEGTMWSGIPCYRPNMIRGLVSINIPYTKDLVGQSVFLDFMNKKGYTMVNWTVTVPEHPNPTIVAAAVKPSLPPAPAPLPPASLPPAPLPPSLPPAPVGAVPTPEPTPVPAPVGVPVGAVPAPDGAVPAPPLPPPRPSAATRQGPPVLCRINDEYAKNQQNTLNNLLVLMADPNLLANSDLNEEQQTAYLQLVDSIKEYVANVRQVNGDAQTDHATLLFTIAEIPALAFQRILLVKPQPTEQGQTQAETAAVLVFFCLSFKAMYNRNNPNHEPPMVYLREEKKIVFHKNLLDGYFASQKDLIPDEGTPADFLAAFMQLDRSVGPQTGADTFKLLPALFEQKKRQMPPEAYHIGADCVNLF